MNTAIPIPSAKPKAVRERATRHVFIRDLVLAASIGVFDREKANSQRVRINLDLKVEEGDAPVDDRLENVLCYQEIVDDVTAIIASGHINLVETLAERIAERVLARAEVVKVAIKVEKLDAVPNATSVGIAIERARDRDEGR